MNYVSYAQMLQDVLAWERSLPEFDAVCGVPRSGLMPASILATRRNIRLVSLSDLLRSPETAIADAKLRDSNPKVRKQLPVSNRLLIVDDSTTSRAVTLGAIREQLKDVSQLQIRYGALYCESAASVDLTFREVPQPRMFAWNWFRHWDLQFAALDMDGVICEDWLGQEQGVDDPKYLNFIRTVRPLYVPEVRVKMIVTGRLSRYRAQTEEWLTRHGVQYESLSMCEMATPKQRLTSGEALARKVKLYANDSQLRLFVESDSKAAAAIARGACKPVLCMDDQRVHQ
jgi:uncharacterized HAD superfamily protein/hypoxanthine phosphoribosyltransferase